MEFKPQRLLPSSFIKNALKAYVVGPLKSKYQVCGVRSLCVDGASKEKIWIARRLLESVLEENPHVVFLFSCITTLSEEKYGKKNRRSDKDCSNSEDETLAEQLFDQEYPSGLCLTGQNLDWLHLRIYFQGNFSCWP